MSYLEPDHLPPMMPRRLKINSLMLDLFHRDACYKGRWLGFFPREFEVMWRLAESGGQTLSRKTLLETVWRLQHDPQTNRVQVAIARIRAKLEPCGVGELIETVAGRGYRISAQVHMPGVDTDTQSALDLETNSALDMQPLDATVRDSYLNPGEAGLVMQSTGHTNDPSEQWKSCSRAR